MCKCEPLYIFLNAAAAHECDSCIPQLHALGIHKPNVKLNPPYMGEVGLFQLRDVEFLSDLRCAGCIFQENVPVEKLKISLESRENMLQLGIKITYIEERKKSYSDYKYVTNFCGFHCPPLKISKCLCTIGWVLTHKAVIHAYNMKCCINGGFSQYRLLNDSKCAVNP